MVSEDGLDIVVASDHPITQFRAKENRLLLSGPAQVLRRVLQIGFLKRIESLCLMADRTSAGWCLHDFCLSLAKSGSHPKIDLQL